MARSRALRICKNGGAGGDSQAFDVPLDARLRQDSGAERQTARQKSGRLRFVIQKHAARRLHFDLRLEVDSVFKSWAVTRGPSVAPQDKRLAVEVEDHPLDYGDFEGSDSAGPVWRRHSATVGPRLLGRRSGNAQQQSNSRKGELKFTLDGERLHGTWVLVRMKGDRYGGKRTNWLLIKQRDERAGDQNATEAMLAEDRSIASGRRMADIAAGKGRGPKPFMLATSRRASRDATWLSRDTFFDGSAPSVSSASRKRASVSKKKMAARPRGRDGVKARKTVPAFIAPELCKLLERPPADGSWGHEVKLDGYRMQLRVAAGAVSLRRAKASTGPQNSKRSRPLQRRCPTAHRRRSRRARRSRRTRLRGAAGGALRWPVGSTHLLRLRFAPCEGRGSAQATVVGTQGAPEGASRRSRSGRRTDSLRRTF